MFGGDGPRFHLYEDSHKCKDTWYWHFTFLNNIFPLDKTSKCLSQSWYIANDMQFFVLLCILTRLYYKSRIKFSLALAALIGACATVELYIVGDNDFSVSYRTPRDEYWSLFYYKPFTRMYGYFIGVWLGCEYFTYKHVAPDKSMFGSLFTSIW